MVLERIQGPALQEYIKSKFGWTNEHLSLIDWETLAKLEPARQPFKRAPFCKLVHRWLYLGKVGQSGEMRLCPGCGGE